MERKSAILDGPRTAAYIEPGLAGVFHMSSIGLWHWIFLLLWPPLVIGLEEARKSVVRRRLARDPAGNPA